MMTMTKIDEKASPLHFIFIYDYILLLQKSKYNLILHMTTTTTNYEDVLHSKTTLLSIQSSESEEDLFY